MSAITNLTSTINSYDSETQVKTLRETASKVRKQDPSFRGYSKLNGKELLSMLQAWASDIVDAVLEDEAGELVNNGQAESFDETLSQAIDKAEAKKQKEPAAPKLRSIAIVAVMTYGRATANEIVKALNEHLGDLNDQGYQTKKVWKLVKRLARGIRFETKTRYTPREERAWDVTISHSYGEKDKGEYLIESAAPVFDVPEGMVPVVTREEWDAAHEVLFPNSDAE